MNKDPKESVSELMNRKLGNENRNNHPQVVKKVLAGYILPFFVNFNI